MCRRARADRVCTITEGGDIMKIDVSAAFAPGRAHHGALTRDAAEIRED